MDAQRSCLASYRSSPHPALDWKSPSEVLHGRQPRTLLSMVTPQTRNAQRNGNSVSNRQFEVGSMVYARNYHKGSKWIPGRIIQKVGKMVYLVRTDRGVWRRHPNQLQIRFDCGSGTDKIELNSDHENMLPRRGSASSASRDVKVEITTGRRYPLRERKPPQRFTFE